MRIIISVTLIIANNFGWLLEIKILDLATIISLAINRESVIRHELIKSVINKFDKE